MKLKVLIATLFVAGFAASFALAGGTKGSVDTTTAATTGTTTGTTPDKPKCKRIELQGSNGSGSIAFTVDKSSKKGATPAGTAVTLAIAGAKVHATACVDAAGALTFSHLELQTAKVKKAKKGD